MSKKSVCPACDVGFLEKFLDSETFTHKGLEISLNDIEYSKCNMCKTELTTPEQSRNIDYRLNDEYRNIKGLLTGREIKRIRKKLSLNQIEIAKIVGGGINAFSKYERGEVIQSLAMDNLLRILDMQPETLVKVKNRGRVRVPLHSNSQLITHKLDDILINTHKRIFTSVENSVELRVETGNTWLEYKEAC